MTNIYIYIIFTEEAGLFEDEAGQQEFMTTIDYVIKDLNRDNIDIGSIVILAEGGDILEDIKGIAPPSWPEVVHVQSLMGYEAPVVIWFTSGD